MRREEFLENHAPDPEELESQNICAINKIRTMMDGFKQVQDYERQLRKESDN